MRRSPRKIRAVLACLMAFAASPAMAEPGVDISVYDAPSVDASAASILGGVLDARFKPVNVADSRVGSGVHWLRLTANAPVAPIGVPVLIYHKARSSSATLFQSRGGATEATSSRPRATRFSLS